MEHAGELLKGTQLTVENISEKVGYESVYAFSRAFKQYYDQPPGMFRKNFLINK
jgi:AraC-like DNA-binding protein